MAKLRASQWLQHTGQIIGALLGFAGMTFATRFFDKGQNAIALLYFGMGAAFLTAAALHKKTPAVLSKDSGPPKSS